MGGGVVNLRSPLSRARNHGSAGDGVGHWWVQRYTALLLVPLTVWLCWALIVLIGASHTEAVAWLGRPWNAVIALLFVLTMFYHGALGLQVVVEDYVHHKIVEVTLQVIIKTAGIVGALVASLAILQLAVQG